MGFDTDSEVIKALEQGESYLEHLHEADALFRHLADRCHALEPARTRSPRARTVSPTLRGRIADVGRACMHAHVRIGSPAHPPPIGIRVRSPSRSPALVHAHLWLKQDARHSLSHARTHTHTHARTHTHTHTHCSETFTATADMGLLSKADAVLICVPTPLGQHFEPGMPPPSLFFCFVLI